MKIDKFVKEGTIFGFSCSLSAPLNRKLDEIKEKGLVSAISEMNKTGEDLLLYIEPIYSESRQMYAKSPFRKEKLKKRLSCDIPKGLNLMPFALPDGNEGENSSESEDEAKPCILSIDKIFDKSKTNNSNVISLLNSLNYEEPSSALFKH